MDVAGQVVAGVERRGILVQSGGSLIAGEELRLGAESGEPGRLWMSDGVCKADDANIGESGDGLLVHSGGAIGIDDRLTLGLSSGGHGSYGLTGTGLLKADTEWVGYDGTALFSQDSGTNNVKVLLVGSGGTYEFTGGALNVDEGLGVRGRLDLDNKFVDFDFSGAPSIVDISGTLVNTSFSDLDQGSFTNSLLIISAGQNPSAQWGSFTSSAITHVAGTTLDTTGKSIGGVGWIADPVSGSGTILANSGHFIDMTGGLDMSGGSINLGSGRLIINDQDSQITGGDLVVGELLVGYYGGGAGTFLQSGGDVTVSGSNTLVLGAGAGDVGTYVLSTGSLTTTGGAIIGQAGEGYFSHDAGTHTVDTLTIAQSAGASGTYWLKSGRLVAGDITAGADGDGYLFYDSGDLVVTDSAWEVQRLSIGFHGDATASYTVSSGDVITVTERLDVGDWGTGTVTQTGGVLNADRFVMARHSAAVGTYILSDGLLNQTGGEGPMLIGSFGTGVFFQTGGSVNSGSATGRDLQLGVGKSYAYGEYNISGGSVEVTGTNLRIGHDGTGIMNISGAGTVDGGTNVLLGYTNAYGELNLSGGLLRAGELMSIGYRGTGLVTMTGGELESGNHILVGGWTNTAGAFKGTVNQSSGTVSARQIHIGKYNAEGTWNLSGDGLVKLEGDAARLIVGTNASSFGLFNQSDGTVKVLGDTSIDEGNEFTVGWSNAATEGIYDLSGGSLEVEYDSAIGRTNATGTMNVSGGVFLTGYGTAGEEARDLTIGQLTGGTGVLNISGGEVNVAGNIVTGAGWSRVNFNGSTLTVGGGTIEATWVVLGDQASGDAALTVDGSALSKINTSVLYAGRLGTGTLTQSAGEVSTGFLGIGPDAGSSYTLSGGALAVAGGLSGGGTFDFDSTAVTWDQDATMLDLEDLTILNAGGASVALGSDSLVIVSNVADLSAFGTFTGSALTHVGGGDLTVSGGAGFTGWGAIDDKLIMAADAGTVQVHSDPEAWLTFKGGFSQAGGTVTVNEFIVDHIEGSTPSDISGGQLNADSLKVATIGTGLFTQTGGEVNITGASTLVIGESDDATFGSTGTYKLQGGEINSSVSDISVGLAGTGVLLQSGGDITLTGSHDVFVGDGETGVGEYRLNEDDGTANVATRYLLVGRNGEGLYVQTAGTADLTQFRVGVQQTSTGTALISGGLMDMSSSMVVGWYGTGYMEYTGGEVNVGNHLHVGYEPNAAGPAGQGELIITGTTLDVTNAVVVGDNGGGVGSMTQTNGTVNVGSYMHLGDQATSVGSYVVDGGLLDINATGLRIGYKGTGYLKVTGGGTVDVTGEIDVADMNVVDAQGEVLIESGSLTASGRVSVGVYGSATVTQTGGSVTAGTDAFVGHATNAVGTYILQDGLLKAHSKLSVGYNNNSTGVFIQNGGSVDTGSHIGIGYKGSGSGSYILNDGVIETNAVGVIVVGWETANNTGYFEINGGTISAKEIRFGQQGAGTVLMTDGYVTLTDQVRGGYAANGVGTFTMTGGTIITAGQSLMARDNSGRMVQSGGSFAVGTNLIMANYASADGTYRMEGGELTVGSALMVANWSGSDSGHGHGVFELVGGTVTIGGNIRYGREDFTLDVQGGVLTAARFNIGEDGADGANRVFEQTAGDITIGTLHVGQSTSNTGGTYDLQAGTLDVDKIALGILGDTTANGTFIYSGGDLTVGTVNAAHNSLLDASGVASAWSIADLNVEGTALIDLGTNAVTVEAGTLTDGTIRTSGLTVSSGVFTQTGGSIELTASSVTVASGSTYALGDAGSTGAITEDAAGANLTVNAGGVLVGWADKAGTGGVVMTGTLTNNGRVIADAFDRTGGETLDLTSFTAVTNGVTNGSAGTAGWYARNRGTLSLPPVSIGAGGGATYNWGEEAGLDTPDLVNSLQLKFTSISAPFDAEISLLSNDDPTVVADLDTAWEAMGVEFIGVWLIEDNNAGDDDFADASWSVKFRYDDVLLQELLSTTLSEYDENDLRVYYYDEILGDWVMLNADISQELNTTNKTIWIPDGAGQGEGMYAVVIPEPGTMALLALGGVGMLLCRRKRRTPA